VGIAIEHFIWDCPDIFYSFRRSDCVVARLCQKVEEYPKQGVDSGKTQAVQIEVVDMAKRNIGSSFDDFLSEEKLLEEATAVAVKRVVAYQLEQKISESNLSKTEMARRMDTSRSSLNRLLDPENASVTLHTLQSAVQVLGGRLKIELDFQDHAV
jgi:antitoxin HicB